jgi:hypothetical protein
METIRVIAGTMVFTTALLGYLHQDYWLFVTMFVGLNLFQYGFTDWCPINYLLGDT